ncbi:MAG: efflux RND transporter periplasmic adaptor subunit [Alphaproteobacteria bacterium]
MRIFNSLSLILSTALLLSACSDDKGKDGPPPKTVEVVEAKKGSIAKKINFIGMVKSRRMTTITARTEGTISQIYQADGHTVQEGDRLLAFEHAEVQERFDIAKESVAIAKGRLDRLRKLQAKKTASQRDFDAAKNAWLTAKEQETRAQIDLDKHVMKAPFPGVLGLYKITEGAYVQVGDPLVTLYDPEEVFVEFSVPASFIKLLHKDQKIQVAKHEGVIYSIDTSVDPETHLANVRAELDNSKKVPGQFAEVQVHVKSKQDVIVVPKDALFIKKGKVSAYVVKGGEVELTVVEVGVVSDDDMVEITSGLKGGEQLVFRGQRRLHPGAKVQVHKP